MLVLYNDFSDEEKLSSDECTDTLALTVSECILNTFRVLWDTHFRSYARLRHRANSTNVTMVLVATIVQ